jgi:hypothetical protein
MSAVEYSGGTRLAKDIKNPMLTAVRPAAALWESVIMAGEAIAGLELFSLKAVLCQLY